MNIYSCFLIVCLSVTALSGCSSNLGVNEAASKPARVESVDNYQQRNQSIPTALIPSLSTPSFSMVYESWKGTPYRLGGNSKRGIDCSAFVQVGYSDVFNRLLPRTTGELARIGRWIPQAEAKEGDLVFFKTGRSLRHVGIYLGKSEFLHASTSRGVMISRLDNPYWRRAFWQMRRVQIY